MSLQPTDAAPWKHRTAATATDRVLRVALLTAGNDPHYACGLACALAAIGVHVDFVGSDDLDRPEVRSDPRIRFLNLRGDQDPSAQWSAKVWRLARYYVRLLAYAVRAEPRLFHVLWNNKVEWFDRTLLMAWYRMLGRRVLLTAHNVNRARRDGCDGPLNRLTLRCQYRLCDHVFVHTEPMKRELIEEFGVPAGRVGVIPFGVNDAVPRTGLGRDAARRRLGIDPAHRTVLFFGQIAPYKGLEYLLGAVERLAPELDDLLLLVAGRVKEGCDAYWSALQPVLGRAALRSRVRVSLGHVPDTDVEAWFEAADVLVLPYTEIFQSGVLFLAYGFGLPVIVTDVGALAAEVVEGATGHVCRPRDPADLARALRTFFEGPLYREGAASRAGIAALARERNGWSTGARLTAGAYANVLAER
ncbi:MAG: glycosyltransferase family 4 protein [Steroidobacteraceae bacterium]|jgi:glycosyltransferase involved in cell wall biosynthesis|nr:glycosyltransferase family 4 protein [Steroidobacteraceae bacterium]